MARIGTMETADPLAGLVPKGLRRLEDPQRDLPRVAKDAKLMREIEAAVREAPTRHELHQDDARRMAFLQPQSVHDIEFVLMQRKPGGYRSPSLSRRILSLLSAENHKAWFQQVWTGVTGASTRDHFLGACRTAHSNVQLRGRHGSRSVFGYGHHQRSRRPMGRSSVGVEIDPQYLALAERCVRTESADLFRAAQLEIYPMTARTG